MYGHHAYLITKPPWLCTLGVAYAGGADPGNTEVKKGIVAIGQSAKYRT